MTCAYSPRRHHWAHWVTIGPSETLMLESRAKTWSGRFGSGSRKWTLTPASSYTDTISAGCLLASSGLKVRPLSRVARAMALAGSQWKLSGGHRRTSRRRPYSESTPQAGSARVVASIVGYHLSSWMPARCREYEGGTAVGRSGGRERGPAAVSDFVRRRVVVHGHVQGVFFRDTTRREASRRGVAGWVTNRPGGAGGGGVGGAPGGGVGGGGVFGAGPRGG